jgi:hypothetical protein
MGTVKRRWIESMEPKEEPPIERERLQCGDPGYTAGISAGADSKPTLTDAEREALENAAYFLRQSDEAGLRCAATLRGLLERTK